MKRLISFFVLLTVSLGMLSAQNAVPKKVAGTVLYAENQEPVIGAYVYVEGTNNGTVTDVDGRFELNDIPSTAKFLVASYLGVKDSRIPIAATVKFLMEPDSELLEEVVVTGMQKMDRRLFTGSSAKIDASEAKLDGMSDVSRSLEGKVAGVSVQNVSGTFGTAPKIRVRGATSIYGSSKPLWVVDGVIVVTTKKGRAGQSRVGYTGEYTIRLKPSYSTFNIMNSQDQMAVYQELQQKGYLNYAETSNAADCGIYGKMYQLLSQYDSTTGQFGLENTPEARAAYLRAAEYRNTDWFGLLFRNSLQHNHSVSMSGGTDKGTYYASLSAMFDPGWTEQSSVNRYTVNLNSSYNLSRTLKLNLIGNASYRKQRAPGTLSSNVDAVTGEVTRDFDINPYSYLNSRI